MAEVAHDIIIKGFRTTLYTQRGPRKADGSPGDIIQENAPDHWVKYCNRGMPLSMDVEERLRFMDPANLKDTGSSEGVSEKLAFLQYRWDQIKPAFDAWVSGQAMPEYGIPLSAWPAVNPDQIKMLVASGVKSVEDVRDLSETQMGKIRMPNLRELKRTAGIYIESLSGKEVTDRLAALEATNDGLKEQLAAAMALLEEQAQKNAETLGGKRPAKAA